MTRPVESGDTPVTLPRLLADIGAVVAVGTAVLYYFGWVRTRFQARVLGFDVAALNLSTTDYLLKSLNVLFLPLVGLTVAALALHQAHLRWVLPRRDRPRVQRAARLLGRSWIPLAALAAVLLLTPLNGYAMPLTLTAALLLARYGKAVRDAGHWPLTTRVILAVLLVLAVFWCTERVARTLGEAFGRDYAAAPAQLPAVVVYSEKDLLLAGPGVEVAVREGAEVAYRFSYTGLFLLERSGDRSFYLTAVPGRVVVLSDAPTMRVEFRTGS